MRASRFGGLMVIREYLNGLVMSVPGGGTMERCKERAMEMLQDFLDGLGGMMAPGAAGVPLRPDQQGKARFGCPRKGGCRRFAAIELVRSRRGS